MSDPTFLRDDSCVGSKVQVEFREYRPPAQRYRNHQPAPPSISMHRAKATGTAPDTDIKPWVDISPKQLAKGAENGRKRMKMFSLTPLRKRKDG